MVEVFPVAVLPWVRSTDLDVLSTVLCGVVLGMSAIVVCIRQFRIEGT